MDRTAGFAASIAIRQQTIQKLIRVLYNANRLDHFISATLPSVSADLFLSLPQLSLRSSDGNRMGIELFAWGPMSVTPPGGGTESRRVKFRARVLVPQTISISDRRLVFGLIAGSASITEVEIDPFAGGLFSPAALAYIQSPEFQTLITLGIQFSLASLGDLIPPLDISFLGSIATDPSTTVSHATVDEALVLGLDISTGGVTTHGSAGLLIDSSAGNDIGMWTNPRVVPIAYSDVRTDIETEIDAQDATLESFELKVEEGWFHISGQASKTGGSVTFSVHAVPKLIRPGIHEEWDEEYGEHFEYTTPDREELWFDPQDVTVDIDRDWWVSVIEVIGGLLTVGLGVLVVESIVSMIRGNITSGIDQNTPARADRNQEFTISGVSRPPMQLRIETFECHAEGIFVGILIKPQFWSGLMDGPRYIAADEAATEVVRYRASLPPDALPDDPELRVRWTVRRTDTNAILISRDTAALGGLTLSFDDAVVPFLDLTRLSIECRVYRTLGAGTVELLYSIQYLDVSDYVDRSRPFVRWDHQVLVPVVEVEADGSHTILGSQIKLRRSAIHRTAIPGRCRMLRNYSLNKLSPPDWRGYPLVYLDTLPFPEVDLVDNRTQVCDYCFFGGPDKSVPLI